MLISRAKEAARRMQLCAAGNLVLCVRSIQTAQQPLSLNFNILRTGVLQHVERVGFGVQAPGICMRRAYVSTCECCAGWCVTGRC